jgi:hypothetical protein
VSGEFVVRSHDHCGSGHDSADGGADSRRPGALDRAGNFHSEAPHVVERYTRTGPDHMLYEVTLEDPKVFTRPWKMSMVLYRRQGPNSDLIELEYDCYPDLLEQEWDKPDSTYFAK